MTTDTAPTTTPDWDTIAARIRATPEFARIPLHPKAGVIEDGRQFFFDGSVTTYPWGESGLHRLVELTRGAPEPQEILPYLDVLDTLPRDATIVELGAGWAFYTIIAGMRLRRSPLAGEGAGRRTSTPGEGEKQLGHRGIESARTSGLFPSPQPSPARGEGARLIAVEANPQLLDITRRNIALNHLTDCTTILHAAAWHVEGETLNFREAGYGSWIHHRGEYAVASVSVDGLRASQNLDRIHVLHMDVQGAELKVLDGAARSFAERAIDHVFIGTHSNELHEQCRARLEAQGYTITVSLDLTQSASGDGVLVGRL